MLDKEVIPETSDQEALKVYIISMIKIGFIDFNKDRFIMNILN